MIDVFKPVQIDGMKFKNRIIRSATHEGLGDKDGSPRKELMDQYKQLEAGSIGPY
jgi:2,4-dienoyl-CoA reductase-like NADH-dependent reductase (Old Yellow Enzyme family)